MTAPRAEESPDALLRAATRQVDRLVKRSRRDRAVQWVLGVVVAGLLAAGTVLFFQNQAIRDQQHASCVNGNTYRQEDDQIWNYFIGVLIQGKTDQKTLALAKTVEQHIAQLDAPRAC